MKKTLIYISSCALQADGAPGTFLLQELPWLRRHFERVVVCAPSGTAEITEDRPKRIVVTRSLCSVLRAGGKALFLPQFWSEIRHLSAEGMLSVRNALTLLRFTVRGLKLQYWILPLLKADEQTTIYSFWMSYDGFAAALCKQRLAHLHAVARGHAFDIDVQRNAMNPYLMKRFMVRTLDAVYPINQNAKTQILAYAHAGPEKIKVVGVGSVGDITDQHFSAPRFADGVCRIISCALMVPIKQIPLLIDALAAWDSGKLHWVHIGGGKQEAMIRAYAKEKLDAHPMVTYELTGSLQPEEVRTLYSTRPFDAFINTSRNEGTPVSVMEAMHAGLPVIAPRIGGIPELIDDSMGCLYAQGGGVEDILKALRCVAEKSEAETEQMRIAAQARWNERCATQSLLPQLFPIKRGNNNTHE